jgi:hypothetical protein
MKTRMGLALLTLVALNACSSQQDAQNPLTTVLDGVRGVQPDFSPRFTQLLQNDAPVLQVGFIEQDSTANVLLERRDGAFEYWLTADGAHIILQSGMLHSTRGLGEGLLASELSEPLSRILNRRSGYADRFHTFLDGKDRAVTRTYRCLIESAGPKTITLANGPVAVELMTENCRSLDQDFTNFYWVVPATGQIVQSRQWSGPELGAMSTRAVLR